MFLYNTILIFVQLLLTDTVCDYNINKHNDFNIERYSIALQVLLNILFGPPPIRIKKLNNYFDKINIFFVCLFNYFIKV